MLAQSGGGGAGEEQNRLLKFFAFRLCARLKLRPFGIGNFVNQVHSTLLQGSPKWVERETSCCIARQKCEHCTLHMPEGPPESDQKRAKLHKTVCPMNHDVRDKGLQGVG